ncbi:MAG: large-conductance mechanosensitive channel protein MscL [Bacteroidales bacterium]|nr:large-conductance mechanosensitive channel protein MscL [Bacteroidales bacterium]
MINEFKEFAIKGNMIDMAVGIIIGAGFGKIVSSLVNDLIMPPIGMLLGNVNFSELKFVFKDAFIDEGGIEHVAVSLNYGNFIQVVLDFLIIAFCVFMLVKGINTLRTKTQKKKEEAPEIPPAPSKEEVLLSEIRDILKNK